MPKLNVQQNNQNVIQAFKNALAIGNLKGIIASDGNHNFSTAGSNRNLLDNPWFKINQRKTNGTITTNNTYVADRWQKGGSGGSVIIGSDNTLTPSGNGGFRQFNPLGKIISGETYTLSALTTGGAIYSITGIFDSAISGWQISRQMTDIRGQLWAGVRNNGGLLDVLVTGNGDITVNAMKLELGSVSTLANDTPPDYMEELRKCQYYFVRLYETANYDYFPVGFGAEQASNAIRMAIMTPTSLRRAPVTVSFSGTLNITGNGTRTTVTSMSILDVSDTAVLASVVPASMPANQHTYTLSLGANAYIDLSADL